MEEDSDATTCDSDWYNEEVHMVPDSQHGGGDSNSTVGTIDTKESSSLPSPEPALSSAATRDSGTSLLCNLDSTKYYGHSRVSEDDAPSLFIRNNVFTDSTDEEEECVMPHETKKRKSNEKHNFSSDLEDSTVDRNSTRNPDILHNPAEAFDDHLFDRPRFSHSPLNPRRPLTLSSPSHANTAVQSIEIPAMINQYLRDYQQEGVRFLYEHFVADTGAVLCDDMGLGKTVQVIAFMCSVLHKSCTRTDVLLTSPRQRPCEGCFLVICPGSVMYNWTSELETWSHLKYGVYHRDKKDMILDKVKRRKLEVVLTTHETARLHVDNLNSVDWLAVFCDEVQVIKGTCSQVTAALNLLHVTRRYGMTGTALQNNLSELWSILNWANPMCLGTLSEFQNRYEKPILEGQKYNCTKRQLATSRKKLEELEELKNKYVLRRTKSLIASQLPCKEEYVVFCPLSDLQEEIYQAILETEDVQLILHANEPCDCYSGKKRGECCYKVSSEGKLWQTLCNPYTVLLNKCANHLGLLLPQNTASKDQQDKATRICAEVFRKHPKFTKMSHKASFLTLSSTEYCGKMQTLEKLLETFHRDKDKVIIFSMSVKLLSIVEDFIVVKNYVYSRLDGATKIEDRPKLVHTFNSDCSQFVFLISKKCGGVGLNVTGANRVIIFDPSWNPATDQQAEDRAFRIGQSRDVKVFRLISEGTVEEMMYLRQVYKQQLANMAMEGNRERRYFTAVAGDRNQQGELFGYRNLFPLRKPGQPGLNLTIDILKRVDKVEAGIRMAKDQISGMKISQAPMAKQVCEREQSLLPGTLTIAHSGGQSVVGNSKVEEHLSKEAQSSVFEKQQHSQEPANYASNKCEGVSDESDDVDFKPPTPKKKVCKTKAVNSPSQCTSATLQAIDSSDSETEEAKSMRRSHFEEMAIKFGFSSPLEFAVHVTSISKEQRGNILEEFYGVSPKKKARVQSKAKVKRKPEESEEEASTDRICEVSKSSGKKRNLPTSVSRSVRPSRAKTKRKGKGLQFVEESPPKKICLNGDSANADNPASSECTASVTLVTDALASTGDSTCLEDECIFLDEQFKEIHDINLSECELTPPHPVKTNSETSSDLDLTMDSNALIDRLFDDSHPVVSTTSTPPPKPRTLAPSPDCIPNHETPSTSNLSKVKDPPGLISTKNADSELNIDELLFGF